MKVNNINQEQYRKLQEAREQSLAKIISKVLILNENEELVWTMAEKDEGVSNAPTTSILYSAKKINLLGNEIEAWILTEYDRTLEIVCSEVATSPYRIKEIIYACRGCLVSEE